MLERAGRWLKRLLAAFADREVPTRSVALGYYAFFSLFPLIFLAMAALGFLLRQQLPLAQELEATLTRSLSGLFVGAGELVEGVLEAVRENAGTVGVVGLLSLLWGVSGTMGAVATAITRIFDPEAPFPSLRVRLRAGLVVLGVGGGFVLLTLGGQALAVVTRFLPFGEWLVELYRWVANPLLAVLAFALQYRLLPTRPPPWAAAFQGALVGGGLFALVQLGFSFYLRWVSFQNVFGPLASVAVLLVWLHFSALAFLLGALVAALLHRAVSPSPAVAQSRISHGAYPRTEEVTMDTKPTATDFKDKAQEAKDKVQTAVNETKAKVGEALEESGARADFEALKADFQALRSDVMSLMSSLKETAGSKAKDLANELRHTGGELTHQVKEKGSEIAATLETQVKDRPLMSLLVAFGAGLVLSRMINRH
ncbi:YhjD/YihY/BrkB family envelope integrity protein [Calidithermus chliarophilus]|uniref:YhjD/YihY/BrkB family envelope integrity protein n=1 Tax=Calidithermus chliarophilus TaxID=52023 RepID=UPI0003FF059E|nr:YhjD/YihY/BrkB family envelope integrity protein [Calidithermus chliarophilus]